MSRGHFGIGISHGKTRENLGSLWRTAQLIGADYLFTVACRYKPQTSDTMKTWRHIPLWHFPTVSDLKAALPRETLLIGVELDDRSMQLAGFRHPERACCLLGAEDHGLTPFERAACYRIVQLPGDRSMNVAAAGSIVMYDRYAKACGALKAAG